MRIGLVVQSLEVRQCVSCVLFIGKQRVYASKSSCVPFPRASADELRQIGQLEAVERGRRRRASQIAPVRREAGEAVARRGELL